jgi:hypothetical protein
MKLQYLALQDRDDEQPYGVIRIGPDGVYRYSKATDEWLEAPSHADVVMNGEPGAREIDEAEALRLCKTVPELHPAFIEHDTVRR